MKDPIYRSETAAHGGSIEIEVTVDYDVAVSAATKLFRIKDDLKGYSIISAQAVWADLTGTLNGTIDLVQSHDGANFDSTGSTHTIASAAGSITLEEIDFNGKYAGIDFAKVGLTGGTIKIIFIAKRK